MASADDPHSDLAERVAALEQTVAALQRGLAERDALREAVHPAPGSDAAARGEDALAAAPRAAASAQPSRTAPAIRFSRPTITLLPADPGQWVNRLGIALVLFGAAFGFKYSIDRGWIGPGLRVLLGLGLGATMLWLSPRVRAARPGLSRILAGGGIACCYLSVFAAFQFYALVSHGVAFLAMSVVTTLAFVVGVRDDEAMTAVVGTIGGLATPFLLSSGGAAHFGVVGYTCLVVASASAVFAGTGWRALLWTATIGGWASMASVASGVARGAEVDAMVVEAGIIFVALATWWLSVVRETWSAEDPQRWKPASPGLALHVHPLLFGRLSGSREQSHQLTLATPLLVLLLSTWTWKLAQQPTGWLSLSLAGGWALAALHLRSISVEAARRLAGSHALGAAVMLAFALALLLGEDARRVGLAAEALALVVLAGRIGDQRSATVGHVLFAIVSLISLERLGEAIAADDALAPGAELADLFVVALLAGAALRTASGVRELYFLAAEGGLLVWLVRVLEQLPDGAALVTAAWFVNAVVLVIAGLRRDSAVVRGAGAAVMALTMGKLFVFDLATVDASWRVVTFLAFGVVLLVLGYAFPALWVRRPGAAGESE